MTGPTPTPPSSATAGPTPDYARSALIVYILYLVSLVVGITAIVGVVMAYLYRDGAPDWLGSHFLFQIRTFWIGLLFSVVGAVLSVVVIGWLVLALTAIWFIVRCVKGIKLLGGKEPIADPGSWMFG